MTAMAGDEQQAAHTAFVSGPTTIQDAGLAPSRKRSRCLKTTIGFFGIRGIVIVVRSLESQMVAAA